MDQEAHRQPQQPCPDLHAALRWIRRLQRSPHRKVRGANNCATGRFRRAKAHATVVDQHPDPLHKLATGPIREHQTVCIEHLNRTGMAKNRKPARSIADACWRLPRTLLASRTGMDGPREGAIARLMEPLEQQLGGKIVLDPNGRFYLQRFNGGKMEMPLVAEGWRKLAMLLRLIATGSLLDKGCLFWDEPEANLNPRLIREVARAILAICQAGVQAFVATHSLFLLQELEILLKREFNGVEQQYFALRPGDDGVDVSQADDLEDTDPLLLLDENLEQSDRFLDQFMSDEES